MLFIGDLPQSGFNNVQLQQLFEPYGTVICARVMTNQCYGFVEFSKPEEAQEALLAVRAGAARIDERPVRGDWAQGELPNWKRTSGGGRQTGGGGGSRGRRKGRRGAGMDGVRDAAAAVTPAAPVMLICGGGGAGTAVLALGPIAAVVPGAHGGAAATFGSGGAGPKPMLLSYDDL